MMPYQDWIARGPAVCDAECAEAMGWKQKPGSVYWNWGESNGAMPVIIGVWSPTTDRNATAMMLETIELIGPKAVEKFDEALRLNLPVGGRGHSWLRIIKTETSLLAYCALRALKEEA